MTNINHTFVVCAYKDNPYLGSLLESLLAQTAQTEIFVSTSTPSDYIYSVAGRYGVTVVVNENGGGNAVDWNFGYSKANTKYVTLAHQDDYYEPDFLSKVLAALGNKKDPIISFTDYFEIRDDERTYDNKLLRIKRFMNRAYRVSSKSIFIRNRVMSFGDPICAPTITYNKDRIPLVDFSSRYKNSCDWEAVCRLSRMKGDFIYIPEPLVGHRIYEESQTSSCIESGVRTGDDLEILCMYWPRSIAKLINKFYSKSQDSNAL